MIELESISPGLRVLRFAHGPVSALDTRFLLAIRQTLAQTARSGEALVLTGTGTAFSAGVDLRSYLDGGPAYVDDFWPALSGVFSDLLHYPRPVVAAINGHAIAGGCVIACCADYRVMSGGTIGVPEMLVGIPFPSSALAAVRLTVGPRAASLVCTGENLAPAAALAQGLVDEVVEPAQLRDRAIARATRMAAVPPETFGHTKAALRREILDELAGPGSTQADAQAQQIWASPAGRGAVAAFVEATLPRKG